WRTADRRIRILISCEVSSNLGDSCDSRGIGIHRLLLRNSRHLWSHGQSLFATQARAKMYSVRIRSWNERPLLPPRHGPLSTGVHASLEMLSKIALFRAGTRIAVGSPHAARCGGGGDGGVRFARERGSGLAPPLFAGGGGRCAGGPRSGGASGAAFDALGPAGRRDQRRSARARRSARRLGRPRRGRAGLVLRSGK